MASILIAEDSPDIRALIQMLLEAEGHRVYAVADGRAAVAAARDHSPELVLMDLSLPILSGWEAARQIRADPATSAIPIVAVTAHAMHGDRERALAAGCDGFIAKPINEETFASRALGFIDARKKVPESSRPRQTARSEPGRILVVDDQPEIARLLRTDLEADGHQVVIANGVEQAEAAFEADARFDLAVIDVMLGSRTGYELTERLTREPGDYVPVLLVTAGTIDRERGFEAGADDFIGKPLDTVELRARARSLIRVGRAIREQRRVGRERSEAYRKLEELDRLKSDFLSTVSHELRTPLNTIILLAHQLERSAGHPEPNRMERDVRLLREAAETLRQMINNILDLAKLEAGQRDLHPERFAIREFLQETANLLEPQAAAKGLELRIEADPGLAEMVHLDREKVSRVLVNLLSNAVKYTRAGSVRLGASAWQGSVSFEVRDTGSGIPAELVAKAFEPFQQIRTRLGETPRGTGLGLSISKQLVQLMIGVSRIQRDVTERRRQRDAMIEARMRAEDANATKDRFLANLSHELRTPLTPIVASVHRLEQRPDLPPGVSESLAMIRRNVELEARLIDDLLDLTRIARGKLELHPEPLDLHELLASVLQSSRSELLAKGLTSETHLDATEHFGEADGGRLQQVFWNLMRNAIKFTPAGGRVTVTSDNPAPGQFRVRIRDTGRGIAPQLLGQIFEPFVQGDTTAARSGAGLGLGLSISKTLVEQHGGSIEAASDGLGEGACFAVRLATTKARPARASRSTAVGTLSGARGPVSILLVEDDADTADAMQLLLSDSGFEVHVARTVAEAEEAFRLHPTDVLVSDVGLPDGSGLEVLGRLRVLRSDLPGIVLSGYGMEQDVAASRANGFAEHFIKPVNFDRLIAAIDRLASVSG